MLHPVSYWCVIMINTFSFVYFSWHELSPQLLTTLKNRWQLGYGRPGLFWLFSIPQSQSTWFKVYMKQNKLTFHVTEYGSYPFTDIQSGIFFLCCIRIQFTLPWFMVVVEKSFILIRPFSLFVREQHHWNARWFGCLIHLIWR